MPVAFTVPKALAALALTQGAGGALQNPNVFNPQIAVVGDFASVLGHTHKEDRRSDFREIEFGFAADADPFLRVEAYVALERPHAENSKSTLGLSADKHGVEVDVEEAFGRYSNLGRGMSLRFGKIAAAMGRVQRNHKDQLGYLDYPMVVQDVFGEEGMRVLGVSLSHLFPGERFSELTLEVLQPSDEGPVFSGDGHSNPMFATHYRTFFDFSEDLSAQLGLSFLTGPGAEGSKRGDVFGLDYTMKYRPGRAGRSWVFEGEAYWTKAPGDSKRRLGAFARLMVETAPKLWVTAGYDTSEVPGTSDHRKGYLLGVTYKVTEFHHWRLEWQRIMSSLESDLSVLTLQFQWVIGAHPAHRY